MVLFLPPSAASLQFSEETSEMVNQQTVYREKLATLNPLFSCLLKLSAASSCNSIMSLLILCALPKALATRRKPLIENLFWVFFSRYFSISHCDGGMLANVTSHGLKVQKIIPVRTTKQSLEGFLVRISLRFRFLLWMF